MTVSRFAIDFEKSINKIETNPIILFYYLKIMTEFYCEKPRVTFYDLETTGLNYYHERIIEIAAESDGETFCDLCHVDGKPLPEIITKLTGITDEMLTNATPEKTVLRNFCHFVGRTRTPVYLVAHNNEGFDRWFLKVRANNYRVRLPSSWRYVDSLQLAKLIYPNRDSYSLNSLCKDLDVTQIQAHRAGDDVRCLKEIFVKMAKTYNKQRGLSGNWDDHISNIWEETQLV